MNIYSHMYVYRCINVSINASTKRTQVCMCVYYYLIIDMYVCVCTCMCVRRYVYVTTYMYLTKCVSVLWYIFIVESWHMNASCMHVS